MKQTLVAHYDSWVAAYGAHADFDPRAIFKRIIVDGKPRIGYFLNVPSDEDDDLPFCDYCRCSNPDCEYKADGQK